jgi:hypothetical protein
MAAGNTYEAIATQTLGSAAASVTFSSIPGTYTDLVIVVNCGNSIGNGYFLSLQFNSDTGSNYSSTWLYADGSSASSVRESSTNRIFCGWSTNAVSGTSFIINIQNYSNTTTNKTTINRFGAAAYRLGAIVGLYRSTSAITSVVINSESASNFLTGSTFSLYGIASA